MLRKKTRHQQSSAALGFTIVELLIVIIVIGILAAITIVAYNGIQNRAKNTQLLSAIDAYEKAFRMHLADGGEVPVTRPEGTSGVYRAVCLGDTYPAESGFGTNQCSLLMQDGAPLDLFTMIVDESVNELFQRYMPDLPDTHKNILTASEDSVSLSRRGIRFLGSLDGEGNPVATLAYSIRGDQACGRGEKTLESIGAVLYTSCTVTLQ